MSLFMRQETKCDGCGKPMSFFRADFTVMEKNVGKCYCEKCGKKIKKFIKTINL